MRLLDRLVCAACRWPLEAREGGLLCPSCARSYPIVDGVPDLRLPDDMADEQFAAIAEWDEMAGHYHAVVAAIHPARFVAIDRPLLAVARGDVLEVGCGDGRLLSKIDPALVRSVIGVDLSLEMAKLTRARGYDAVAAPAERLPFADRSFDAVLSGYYALRFCDLELALREIARVLRPGGAFAFTLLARRAVAVAGRLAALPLLLRGESRAAALRLLTGRDSGLTLATDVSDAAALRARLGEHGLIVARLTATPYLPVVGGWVARQTGGKLPYLREPWSVRVGFDIIVAGRRRE